MATIQREFIPGSEWLYFKLYSGHKSADNILLEYIHPTASKLLGDDLISDYFFIRYSDPSPHVRLRFKICTQSNYARVFKITHDALSKCIDKGLIHNVLCDTYKREIERYGESTMELSETVFGVDSRAILSLLEQVQQSDDPETLRWQLSLRLLDDLLSAMGYDLAGKSRIMQRVSTNFRMEMGCNKQPFSGQLNDKYRDVRSQIEKILSGVHEASFDSILQRRKDQLSAIYEQIISRTLTVPLDDLICSYMHMSMNRWFRSKNRIFEMLIYHFLDKHYKSEIARSKINRDISML